MPEEVKSEKNHAKQGKTVKMRWLWPVGFVATSVAGMAVLALRGCWHRRMSWPVRAQGYSYQVCVGCGVKRLFDEKSFTSYGPFRYDLNELITWEKAHRVATTGNQQIERSAS